MGRGAFLLFFSLYLGLLIRFSPSEDFFCPFRVLFLGYIIFVDALYVHK